MRVLLGCCGNVMQVFGGVFLKLLCRRVAGLLLLVSLALGFKARVSRPWVSRLGFKVVSFQG